MTQIASAASAASAVPPHEYSPAAEQHFEVYSPSYPGVQDPEPGVSPSGMSQFQQDECMQMMNTQDTEPGDFLRARQSSSSGSKRKH